MLCSAAICFAAGYHSYSQISKSESSLSFDSHVSQSNKLHISSTRNQMILLIIVGMAYIYTGVLYLAYVLEQ